MTELKCINCDNDINDEDDEEHFIEATIDSASKFCHLKCFRCNICSELLTGWYFEKGGLVYCRKDYYQKYGERCRNCCNVMSGPVMVVGGSEIKFHPECFKCSNCSAIIGDDESYACLQECELYCKICFTDNSQQNDAQTLKHCLHFHEVGCDSLSDEQQTLLNNNHHYNQDDIHKNKFIGNGRQYRVRILPSLQVNIHNDLTNEGKISKRMIKLIVRDCQINNRSNQLQHHHQDGNDVVSYQKTVKNNNDLQTSLDEVVNEHKNCHTSTMSMVSTTNGAFHISDIDVKFDLDHFHIGGDRLIELNKVSIQNKTLSELESLLDVARDDIVELTLEHRSQPDKNNTEDSDLIPTSFDASSSFDSECPSDNSKLECDEKPQEVRVLGKPPIRPNSLFSTNNLNSIKNNCDENHCLNNSASDKNCQESVRKSRVQDKRTRNRERSSSLSRLLESIRLSSEMNSTTRTTSKTTTNNECCDYYPTEDQNDHDNETVKAIPKLLSSLSHTTRLGRYNNSLSRTKSFRVEPKSYRIFRAADLVKGALLGKGSFGEVYEVTDKVTKEKMVLKELYHNDREAEANFVREVQILKSLNHKNVLHFIGILYRGRKLNLITEYITGGTLKELIQQQQNLGLIYWPERIGWARDIASGMNYLHSMSLIHRDLNSQNCLVREDGTVVVADFGLSKIICTDDNDENINFDLNPQMQKLIKRRDRRKRYTIVGNPFWMAPEMMHRNKYDERVDIYSFGIILLEIIGSMDADPDDLRRNGDFSVDKKYFLENFVQKSCPSIFWQIAFLCTEMNPDHRPPFHVQERWFQVIYNSMAYSHQKLSFRNLADSGTLFQNDSNVSFRENNFNDSLTNYDNLMPHEIEHEVRTFNIPQSPSN